MRPTSWDMPDQLAALPRRAALSLTGPDTLPLLERLVTNKTSDWPPGQARYGALLTPQGKVIADFIALRTGDGVLLDVSADYCETLARRLAMFRLRSDVQIAPRDDLAITLARAPFDGGFADPRSPDMPYRMFARATDLPDADWYDAIRIASGVPEQGEDFGGAEVFPAEINMDRLGGVDLKKGCFVGQEVVSRMHRRGNIRKRTLVLHGRELTPGTDILAPAPLGTITSAAADLALARVRLDRLAKADGQALSASDKPVTVKKTDWLQTEIEAFIQP